MTKSNFILVISLVILGSVANASVDSSLAGLKDAMFGSILPVFALMGLGFAACSFIFGNPNAKQHLAYAVTGAVILFGAQSIIDLLQRVIK